MVVSVDVSNPAAEQSVRHATIPVAKEDELPSHGDLDFNP